MQFLNYYLTTKLETLQPNHLYLGFLIYLLFFCKKRLVLNLGKKQFRFSDYHQHIPIATTTTLASTTSTETQEYVDEIYDEDYYMAPSIMDPYVPPRECNKIE